LTFWAHPYNWSHGQTAAAPSGTKRFPGPDFKEIHMNQPFQTVDYIDALGVATGITAGIAAVLSIWAAYS